MNCAPKVRHKTFGAQFIMSAASFNNRYHINPLSPRLSACRFRSKAKKEHLLEHRTDGTDASDTLYIGAEKSRIGKALASRLRDFCSGCERRSPREWACSVCRNWPVRAGAGSQSKTHRKSSRSTTLFRLPRQVFSETVDKCCGCMPSVPE